MEPPSPAVSIPPSPALYVPFGAPTPSAYQKPTFEDPGSGGSFASSDSANQGGCFVSEHDLVALQQWASERQKISDRLDEAERLASQRADEAAKLRERLAETEAEAAKLRAVTSHRVEEKAALHINEPQSTSSFRNVTARHTATEAEAIATARCIEVAEKRKRQAAALRKEFGELRGALQNSRRVNELGSGA